MECFKIYLNEIEGRLDPFYYRPVFRGFEKKLNRLRSGFKKMKLLGDLNVEIRKGIFNLQSRDYKQQGIPFLRISNIGDREINFENMVFISEEDNEREKRTELSPGDLVFSKIGTIDRVGILPDKFKKYNMSQNIVGVKLKNLNRKELNPKYLQIFFLLDIGKIQLRKEATFQVQPKLTLDGLRNIKIPILSPPLQNHIVQIMDNAYALKKSKEAEAQRLLDSVDDYVLSELGIKIPELKDKMTFSVYSDDVKGRRLDPYYYQPKFEEVEKAIEKGKYEAKELKKFITKIHYGASVKNEYVDKGIPLLRILNLKENVIDLTNVVKLPESMREELGNAFVKEDDLLISRSGTVGLVSVVPKEADGFAFGSFMIRFCLKDGINKYYVSTWLNTKLQKLLTEREKIGAIQKNITIGTIESFKIPLPPLDIQSKIAEEVKSRMEKAKQLQKEAKETLEKAKQEVEKIILGEENI